MRKIASLLSMLIFLSAFAFGQKIVSGQIKDEKGDAVPFASVIETGTKNGTTADGYGNFLLKIKEGSTITITAQGYKPRTLTPSAGAQLITLTTDVTVEKEVVVTTAFGIKKAARITPYSSQVITSEALNIVPSANLNSSLAGKVAGVQYRGQSSMKLNSEGFLRIRGGLSLGDVGPIYVVDGTITNSYDINPDDIESLNILKGANATALFGSDAKNGAVVITTRKKGYAGTSGIEFNQSITFDKVYLLPQYQNTFGGGQNAEFTKFVWNSSMPIEWKALDGKYWPDYTDDSSWGPRMVGQEYIPWYAWYPGSKYSYATAKWIAQPNNAKDFYNTGITTNTYVSFAKAGQGYTSRISYTNNMIKGMIPYSSSERHTLFGTFSVDLNAHFSAGANITFVDNKIRGEFNDGYANQSSGSFNSWFHRDLDMHLLKELQNLRSPFGTLASWNLFSDPSGYNPASPDKFYKGNYWYNYYAYFNNIDNRNVRDRIVGDVYVKYAVNKNLSFMGTVRKNQLNTSYENIVKSIIEASALQTGDKASYGTGQTRSDIMTYDFVGSYQNKFFGKLDMSANAGGSWNRTRYQDVTMSTRNGLSVPDLYAITNSKDPINYGNTRQFSETRSLFASGDFEWNRTVSLSWAMRDDWFSVLVPPAVINPQDRLFTASLGVGFVFSEFTKNKLPWLSFGKISGSWGTKPTTIGVYSNNFAYSLNPNQWNGNFLMSTPDQLVDPGLKGSVVSTYEMGLDLRFKNNRYGINVTYYNEDNDGEPLAISVSGISGFTSKLVNAAEVKRQGLEVQINATILKSRNFNWDVTKTVSYIINNPVTKLNSADTTVKQILVARGASFSGFTAPGLFDELGSQWGQLIGMGIKRNSAGIPEIKGDGTYLGDPTKHWGSVVPKVNGGLVNTFSYKNWNLNFSIDYQIGGRFFSLSEMWGNYSGLYAPTAAVNDKGMNVRDAVADGGGVHVVGVSAADEKTPVDVYVDAQTYFHGFFNSNVIEPYIHSLTYVKLRQIALGYEIPVQKLKIDKIIKGANFSVISSNTLLIYRETKSFDPSEISALQGEDGQYPGTRSLGFDLKLRF